MKIKPSSHYVVVILVNEPDQMNNGIFIPAKEHAVSTGKVVDIGVSVTGTSIDQVVLFEKWSSREYGMNGDTYFLVKDENIIGSVEE